MSGTTGIVTFDYQSWALRYPEFVGTVSQALATLYFNEACLYLDNTASSIVSDTGARAMLLNMLTAHIAALNQPGSSQLVGRINDATTGSVHVSAEYAPPGTDAWFSQTKYGAAYIQAVKPFVTFDYVAPPQPFQIPFFGPGIIV